MYVLSERGCGVQTLSVVIRCFAFDDVAFVMLLRPSITFSSLTNKVLIRPTLVLFTDRRIQLRVEQAAGFSVLRLVAPRTTPPS